MIALAWAAIKYYCSLGSLGNIYLLLTALEVGKSKIKTPVTPVSDLMMTLFLVWRPPSSCIREGEGRRGRNEREREKNLFL